MNELSSETSPYLLQHAQNPVHWKAWNPEALQHALREDKLIVVSVGYSACHWCHVMEHESFEDEEVAAVMNAHFVSFKVDREERPDIDAVYMKAVQLMSGQGGWPLNVVCLPDGRPVWGGTYFHRKHWIETLSQLASIYREDRERMLDYARKLDGNLQLISSVPATGKSNTSFYETLPGLLGKWRQGFDPEYGGMARAPKFPMPDNLQFLMYYGHLAKDETLLAHVDLTLTRMAWGGIFDCLGGGFSRYSVDSYWHVPHFEKMLYDNAQLLSLYADAYKRTGNRLYLETVEKTANFLLGELSNGEGGFYSALDADSLNAEGKPEEGAFYAWAKEEIENFLGDDAAIFGKVFNINDFGFWEHGHYVLIQNRPLESIAIEENIDLEALENKKSSWEKRLFDARKSRPRPRLDDKCLTSWNAMAAKGFVDAYKATGNKTYLDTAAESMDLILSKMVSGNGSLWRSYKDGKAAINAYLEDYAHVVSALLSIYEATYDDNYLGSARQLADYAFDHFYDESGFFRFTSDADAALVAPHYEVEDNVIPASNSVMARNLLKLSIYFGHQHYADIAHQMLERIFPSIDYPAAFSNWLSLLLDFSPDACQVAVCGPDAHRVGAEISKHYLPHATLAGAVSETNLPFLADRYHEGRTEIYVCKNHTCDLPSTDVAGALKKIRETPTFG